MKILIELPTWLGDCVMTTPAIEVISDLYPDATITFAGSPVSIEAMKHHPQSNKVFVLEKNYLTLYRSAKSLGAFDLFLSFRGSRRSFVFKLLVSAKRKHQFSKQKYRYGHQVERYAKFVNDSLGVNCQSGVLKLYRRGGEIAKASPRLGINPGASYGSAKRWYPDKFAKVASQLSNKYDIAIFGGPDEQDMANDIEKNLVELGVKNYQNLAGKTDISTLIDQIANLDLFITGDSGPMHVAAAFQVPTVAIFGPTKDKETSQWMNAKSTIVKKDLDCQPCMKRTCPLRHHNCMALISPDEVIEAVNSLSVG